MVRGGCTRPVEKAFEIPILPAACRRHPALASRWRGACGPTPGAGISGQGGMGWADAVGGKGRLIFLSPRWALWGLVSHGAWAAAPPERSGGHGTAWSGYPEQNCQIVNSRTLRHQFFEPHTGPVLLTTAAVGHRNADAGF